MRKLIFLFCFGLLFAGLNFGVTNVPNVLQVDQGYTVAAAVHEVGSFETAQVQSLKPETVIQTLLGISLVSSLALLVMLRPIREAPIALYGSGYEVPGISLKMDKETISPLLK